MSKGPVLAQRISVNVLSLSAALSEFENAVDASSEWIQRDWVLYHENPAHVLLTGAKLSFLEAATAWAIGSNRGAAASLRAAIENTFAWLYYKDHPVELRAVHARKIDLMLPKAVQQYLKSVDSGFETAYEMLKKTKKRGMEYYYSEISEYVHAHPSFQGTAKIEDAVISNPRDQSFLRVCSAADEFISDNFLAYYRSSWGDYPNGIQLAIAERLGKKISSFVEIES